MTYDAVKPPGGPYRSAVKLQASDELGKSCGDVTEFGGMDGVPVRRNPWQLSFGGQFPLRA